MLVSKQLTDRFLDDARTITKKSWELLHECRHTICVSLFLRNTVRKNRSPSRVQATYIESDEKDKL
jgi:hypothetical protein